MCKSKMLRLIWLIFIFVPSSPTSVPRMGKLPEEVCQAGTKNNLGCICRALCDDPSFATLQVLQGTGNTCPVTMKNKCFCNVFCTDGPPQPSKDEPTCKLQTDIKSLSFAPFGSQPSCRGSVCEMVCGSATTLKLGACKSNKLLVKTKDNPSGVEYELTSPPVFICFLEEILATGLGPDRIKGITSIECITTDPEPCQFKSNVDNSQFKPAAPQCDNENCVYTHDSSNVLGPGACPESKIIITSKKNSRTEVRSILENSTVSCYNGKLVAKGFRVTTKTTTTTTYTSKTSMVVEDVAALQCPKTPADNCTFSTDIDERFFKQSAVQCQPGSCTMRHGSVTSLLLGACESRLAFLYDEGNPDGRAHSIYGLQPFSCFNGVIDSNGVSGPRFKKISGINCAWITTKACSFKSLFKSENFDERPTQPWCFGSLCHVTHSSETVVRASDHCSGGQVAFTGGNEHSGQLNEAVFADSMTVKCKNGVLFNSADYPDVDMRSSGRDSLPEVGIVSIECKAYVPGNCSLGVKLDAPPEPLQTSCSPNPGQLTDTYNFWAGSKPPKDPQSLTCIDGVVVGYGLMERHLFGVTAAECVPIPTTCNYETTNNIAEKLGCDYSPCTVKDGESISLQSGSCSGNLIVRTRENWNGNLYTASSSTSFSCSGRKLNGNNLVPQAGGSAAVVADIVAIECPDEIGSGCEFKSKIDTSHFLQYQPRCSGITCVMDHGTTTSLLLSACPSPQVLVKHIDNPPGDLYYLTEPLLLKCFDFNRRIEGLAPYPLNYVSSVECITPPDPEICSFFSYVNNSGFALVPECSTDNQCYFAHAYNGSIFAEACPGSKLLIRTAFNPEGVVYEITDESGFSCTNGKIEGHGFSEEVVEYVKVLECYNNETEPPPVCTFETGIKSTYFSPKQPKKVGDSATLEHGDTTMLMLGACTHATLRITTEEIEEPGDIFTMTQETSFMCMNGVLTGLELIETPQRRGLQRLPVANIESINCGPEPTITTPGPGPGPGPGGVTTTTTGKPGTGGEPEITTEPGPIKPPAEIPCLQRDCKVDLNANFPAINSNDEVVCPSKTGVCTINVKTPTSVWSACADVQLTLTSVSFPEGLSLTLADVGTNNGGIQLQCKQGVVHATGFNETPEVVGVESIKMVCPK